MEPGLPFLTPLTQDRACRDPVCPFPGGCARSQPAPSPGRSALTVSPGLSAKAPRTPRLSAPTWLPSTASTTTSEWDPQPGPGHRGTGTAGVVQVPGEPLRPEGGPRASGKGQNSELGSSIHLERRKPHLLRSIFQWVFEWSPQSCEGGDTVSVVLRWLGSSSRNRLVGGRGRPHL